LHRRALQGLPLTDSRAHHEPFLRAVLAFVAIADLLSFFVFLGEARQVALANGAALTGLADLLSRSVVRGALVLAGIAGAVSFARAPGRVGAGLVTLGALTLLSTVHAQLFGSPWRHLYYSGLCLAGWLLGLMVSRRRGAPTDESYARVGSIALLGAAYFNAGISKIAFGGTDWVSGATIQAVVVGQDGMVADGLLSLYRTAVVTAPPIAGFFSIATVAFELAGPLMLLGRRIRLVVALGLIAMHANIFLLTHIVYWEPVVLLLTFGLSADEPMLQVGASQPAGWLFDRRFTAVTAALAVFATLAIAHQSWRYHHLGASGVAGEGGTSSADPAGESSRRTLRRIGPFAVGQRLVEDWSVDSLTITDDGLVAALSGGSGRAAFEVSCASSAHSSPFDLGQAHIFYSSDLAFDDLEAVGLAFQAQVRRAAEGQDICDRLLSWRRSAEPAAARER
jgi:hypothetical protein